MQIKRVKPVLLRAFIVMITEPRRVPCRNPGNANPEAFTLVFLVNVVVT
jgi:hypothetical protein